MLHLWFMPTGNEGAGIHIPAPISHGNGDTVDLGRALVMSAIASYLYSLEERGQENLVWLITLANAYEPVLGVFDAKVQAFSDTLYSYPIIPSP